jgi:hypothetical protein
LVIQGSNDNTAWTTLTAAAASTLDWQTLAVGNATPYRYIRLYNGGAWFGNLAEVRLHGWVHAAEISASVQFTQLGATLNRATGKYTGGVTITNTSGALLAGPLRLMLRGLAGGVTLDNASGSAGGVPYVTVPGPLNPGAAITVPLTFNNPARALVAYAPALYQTNP